MKSLQTKVVKVDALSIACQLILLLTQTINSIGMPFVKVWIHFVWATKDRDPLLTNDIRSKVFQHIRENAKEKDIYLDYINGYVEHVHCLISLGKDQTLSKIMNLIKGESSHWINKHQLTSDKFEWQDDYFAVSVSESGVDKVREYIKHQEEHHSKKNFKQELDEMLEKWGFQKFS